MSELEKRLTAEGQLVFVHIPKTAGLTFRAVLANHFDYDETYPRPDEWWWVHRDTKENLSRYRLFNGHYVYSVGAVLQHPYFVTMLRDPVDRLLSTFHHAKTTPGALLHEVLAGGDMTFEEFLDNRLTAIPHMNWQTGFVGSVPLSELGESQKQLTTTIERQGIPSQSYFPSLGVDVAKERLAEFAMFGICERFEKSVLVLDYVFGWKPARDYQSFNIARARIRREDLSVGAIDAALALNVDDSELYEYGIALFDERFAKICQALLDDYGDARHARMKLPLEVDAIVELLEKHYRKRQLETRREPERSFVWDAGAPVAGFGWHPADPHGRGRFGRWTGPESTTTIDLDLAPDTDYLIEFELCGAIDWELLDGVDLAVNDVRIDLKQSSRIADRSRVYEGFIPGAILVGPERVVSLTWKVARTMRPNELDPANGDPRRLGVMFRGVKILPAPSR